MSENLLLGRVQTHVNDVTKYPGWIRIRLLNFMTPIQKIFKIMTTNLDIMNKYASYCCGKWNFFYLNKLLRSDLTRICNRA